MPPHGPLVVAPGGGIVNGITYGHILGSGRYTVTDTLKGNVLVAGKALLYIPRNGRIQFSNGDVIRIAKGASLTLCNNSNADATFGSFCNDNNLASRFLYYGLTGTTGSKATFRVDKEFYGALYAPEQNLVLLGSSEHNNDFYGSVVGNTVTLLTSKK